MDRNRALVSERIHVYGQAVLDAFADVEDALLTERKQNAIIESLRKQLTLSDEVVTRIRENYTKGAADYLDVLDALLSNQSLQRSLLEARRILLGYRIDLCRALAGPFDLNRPPLASLREEGEVETHESSNRKANDHE